MPAAKATDLMVTLIKKGFQANVNVNAYRNGGMCPGNQASGIQE